MVKIEHRFQNEHGEDVAISATYDQRGITVSVAPSRLQLPQNWTPLERRVLKYVLDPIHVTPRYKTT